MAELKTRILIVDDDQRLRDLLVRYLGGEGYEVKAVADGGAMDKQLGRERYDLVVLDLMLPGEDGLAICRRLRGQANAPAIVMLTAKGDEVDRIVGLEMGADDYLPKPFNPRELLARINAVLRRQASAQAASSIEGASTLAFEGWRIDLRLRELRNPEGARVAVTSAEFDLLRAFCERPGRVLSRDSLLDLTQGRSAGSFERSIDVLVSRIRRKIESDPAQATMIKTVRAGGYMFTPVVEPISVEAVAAADN